MLAVIEDNKLNRSLVDVVELMEREVARLRESLEFYRLSRHPDRQRLIQRHVQLLDEREDALAEIRALMADQIH